MAQLLSAKGVAERALRVIQEFAINDTAADPEALRETLYWMEMLLDHKAATNKLYFLIPADVLVPLPITADFDLVAAAGAVWPAIGVLSFSHAMLVDGSGRETPVQLLRRTEYEEIEQKNATGRPEAIYIDRLDPSYRAKQWPVPTDATAYRLKLVVQTYNTTVAIDNKALPQQTGRHGLTAGWQLWLIFGTAALIGRGAVRALPPAEIKDLQTEAERLFSELYINANDEKPSEPRRTRSSDSCYSAARPRRRAWNTDL